MKYFTLLLFLSLTLLVVLPDLAQAQTPTFGNFEVPLASDLPTSIDTLARDPNAIVRYIAVVFRVATALIIGVALILIVVAGYLYITAGGDAQKVSLAKSLIGTSLLGIVLALSAYIILDLLNPNLASNLRQPALPPRPPL